MRCRWQVTEVESLELLLYHIAYIMKSTVSNSRMEKNFTDSSMMKMATVTILYLLLLLMEFSSLPVSAQRNNFNTPMNCFSSIQTSCTESYLYFVSSGSPSLSQIAVNFGVSSSDILSPPFLSGNSYMIRKACSCNTSASSGAFFADASYTPTAAEINLRWNLSDISRNDYGGLVYIPPTSSNQGLTANLSLELFCGCQYQDFDALITYFVQKADTANTISAQFLSSVTAIQELNDIPDMNDIEAGQILFIPTNYKPTVFAGQATSQSSDSKKPTGLIAGIITAAVVLLVLVLVTGCVFWCRRVKNHGVYRRSFIDNSGQVSSASTSSRGKSGGSFLGGLLNFHRPNPGGVNNNVKRSITLPREAMDVFDQEKPVVFYYQEIIEATDNFNESRKLGEGSYGAVFSGVLRQQKVAIKQMKTAKSREFYAELKVLCKVHHTNLVELIGYSAGDDSLCLIYEFAENGALSEHLHKSRGSPEEYPPLSWTARVQIALDTARGLEYIHDHTKDHYVHRDVKTSNILIDGFFRAKVADFGLARLVEQNSETFISTSRLVGTFGYMAPELSEGGRATSKIDVYAFGVVLFELITGQQAMTRIISGGRRSIISFMLDVLKEEHDPTLRFQSVVDPRLGDCFPLEWSFKMAKLARACVDAEPANRPDMRTVVFSLSQFLLNSVEWEAALAGSSQIFSGLTQGR